MTAALLVRAALMLAACMAGAAACAQTVYRCGPEGRVYSQMPCAHGRVVDVGDARSEQQRQDAQSVTDTQRALAQTLEGDRLQREARLPRAAAASLGPHVERARPARGSEEPVDDKKRKGKKGQGAQQHDADFTALVPGRRKP